MISHEAILWVACGISAALGWAIGRMRRVDADYPPAKPTPPKHPYREGSPPDADEDLDAEEPAGDTVYTYRNYENKIWLRCPHCEGGITEFKTCTCSNIDSDDPRDDVHFHVTCPFCFARFAMETAVTSKERLREKKKAETKAVN